MKNSIQFNSIFPLVAHNPNDISCACGPAVNIELVQQRIDWLYIVYNASQEQFATNLYYSEPMQPQSFHALLATVLSLKSELIFEYWRRRERQALQMKLSVLSAHYTKICKMHNIMCVANGKDLVDFKFPHDTVPTRGVRRDELHKHLACNAFPLAEKIMYQTEVSKEAQDIVLKKFHEEAPPKILQWVKVKIKK
jgi:hypothetical protein